MNKLLSTLLCSTTAVASLAACSDASASYELYKENQGIIKQIEDREDEKNLSFLDGQWEVVEYSGISRIPYEYKRYKGKFYILKATTVKKTLKDLEPLRENSKYRTDYLRSVASLDDARENYAKMKAERKCYSFYEINSSKDIAFDIEKIYEQYYKCYKSFEDAKEYAPYLSFFLYDVKDGVVANLPLNYFNHKKINLDNINPKLKEYLTVSDFKEKSFATFKEEYNVDPEDLVDFFALSAGYSFYGIDIIDNDNFIIYEINLNNGDDGYMVLKRIPKDKEYNPKYRMDLLDEYFESIKDEL